MLITSGRKSSSSQYILCQNAGMPSITLSQLRNTRQLIAWLKAGDTIELRERKRVIGHITPVIPWPLLDEEDMPKNQGRE